MNKILINIAGNLAVYFGAALAGLGFAGVFVGARGVWAALTIAVAGILIACLGWRTRKTDAPVSSQSLPFNFDKRGVFSMRTFDTFS